MLALRGRSRVLNCVAAVLHCCFCRDKLARRLAVQFGVVAPLTSQLELLMGEEDLAAHPSLQFRRDVEAAAEKAADARAKRIASAAAAVAATASSNGAGASSSSVATPVAAAEAKRPESKVLAPFRCSFLAALLSLR